jgi:hypothetical protein
MGSNWTFLVGPCNKKSKQIKKYIFLLDKKRECLKLFWRCRCLPNFDRRRFPENSNFVHYFSKIIYECLRLKWGMPSKSRVLFSVQWKPIYILRNRLKQEEKILESLNSIHNQWIKFLYFFFSNFHSQTSKLLMIFLNLTV